MQLPAIQHIVVAVYAYAALEDLHHGSADIHGYGNGVHTVVPFSDVVELFQNLQLLRSRCSGTSFHTAFAKRDLRFSLGNAHLLTKIARSGVSAQGTRGR